MRMVQNSLHNLRLPTRISNFTPAHDRRSEHDSEIPHVHLIDVAVRADSMEMQDQDSQCSVVRIWQ